MPYIRPSVKTIYERIKADMEARLTSGVKIPKTGLYGILARVMAGGSFTVYGFVQWVSEQIFLDTADATGRQRWSVILGIPQKTLTQSSGYVAPTGADDTLLPAGTEMTNAAGVAYLTQTDFLIATDIQVEAVCEEFGEVGNIADGESFLTLSSPLESVDSVVPIVSGFENGVEAETDFEWVSRMLQRFQNPPSSGTPADYVRWALEDPLVSFAWCFPAEEWAGAGTVGLAVSGDDFAQLSTPEVESVDAYVNTKKPIPANLTTYSPAPTTADFDISLTPNNASTRAAVEAAVAELYAADAAPRATMKISRLNTAVGSAAVSDYKVNDIVYNAVSVGAADYTATTDQVPTVGNFSFSAVP